LKAFNKNALQLQEKITYLADFVFVLSLLLSPCGRSYGDDGLTAEALRARKMRKEGGEDFLCARCVSAVNVLMAQIKLKYLTEITPASS